MIRGLLAGAAVACALLFSSPAFALPENTHVIAIGNNHGEPDEVSLLYAERDARELAGVLQQLGEVPSKNLHLVLGESAAEVRRAVIDANTALREAERQGGASSLVVFYSGHADATSLHLGGSRMPFDELRGLVEGSPADMRLLVIDACRSGSITRVKGVKPAQTFEIDLEDRVAAEGMAVITSSAAGEDSQESDRLRGSFFSHHLVNALRGAADRNGDRRITLAEAYSYTYEQTLRSSGRTLQVQHPTYEFDVKGRGELVLTRASEERRRVGRLLMPQTGLYIIAEGHEGGPVAAEVAPARPRTSIALPPNRYFVQHRGADEYREYRVDLRWERTVDLGNLEYRSIQFDRLVRKGGSEQRAAHGLMVLGGARGEVLDGEGPTGQVVVGYGADLEWFSAGARGRFSTVNHRDTLDRGRRRHTELALGLTMQRYVDLPWFSVAFGLLLEGVYHRQSFDTDNNAPTRQSAGLGFGGLLSLERRLYRGLSLRIEGGPMTQIFERTISSAGAARGDELATPLTWWSAAGFAWRL